MPKGLWFITPDNSTSSRRSEVSVKKLSGARHPPGCVSGAAHAVFRYGQASNRPANIMTSWLRAATLSRTARSPFSKLRVDRRISLVAASSVGNEPLVCWVFLSTRLSESTAFVV